MSALCSLDGIFSGRHRSTVAACCHLPAVPYCTQSPYWPFHTHLDVSSTPCSKFTQANPPGRQEEFYLPKKWKLMARTSFRGCIQTLVLQVWSAPGHREDALFVTQHHVRIYFESCTWQLLPAGKTIVAVAHLLPCGSSGEWKFGISPGEDSSRSSVSLSTT